MPSRLSRFLHHITHPVIALGGALIIAGAVVAVALHSSSVIPTGNYTRAAFAPITATGGVSSDLSFQASGQISSIAVSLGQKVSAGTILVALDHAALAAARAGAAANLEAAEAKLASIKAGTRPEQITVDETAVTQGQESLLDAVRSAYINADDAIHNKVDQIFTNARTASIDFAFTVPDQELRNGVLKERLALEGVLSAWASVVNAPSFASSDPIADAKDAQTRLAQVSAFLDDVAQVLVKTPASTAVPLATLQGYQSSVNTARLNVSGSFTAITGATTALQSAKGVLAIAKAGATVNDIAAAQAAVDAAQATLAGIDVSLRQTTLASPVAGTVTALNAHLGQTVTPGQVIVSIESTGGSVSNALVVPSSSVITDNGQSFVYVKSAAAPVKTAVTTGLTSDSGMTEITSGLSEGEEVLTFGTTAE
jgi:multidrug efflux pump subunit AcrA (membrane-fusion protein)